MLDKLNNHPIAKSSATQQDRAQLDLAGSEVVLVLYDLKERLEENSLAAIKEVHAKLMNLDDITTERSANAISEIPVKTIREFLEDELEEGVLAEDSVTRKLQNAELGINAIESDKNVFPSQQQANDFTQQEIATSLSSVIDEYEKAFIHTYILGEYDTETTITKAIDAANSDLSALQDMNAEDVLFTFEAGFDTAEDFAQEYTDTKAVGGRDAFTLDTPEKHR